MHFLPAAGLLVGALAALTKAASDDKVPQPCTAHSSNTGTFFDLSTLSLSAPSEDDKESDKKVKTDSWHSSGWDYKANFTLNICAPVLENVHDVVGVKEQAWRNVSAYYEKQGKIYSIGYGPHLFACRTYRLTLCQARIVQSDLPRTQTSTSIY